jgi:NTE family protein
MRRGGANLASYLLFEQGYCNELIDLGYRDTVARRDEVASFLAGSLSSVAGLHGRTVQFMAQEPQDTAPAR